MIDLSFLTEEEQEAIMKVLNRDADLKKAEEARIRHLEETVEDDSTLKNMSGQWFYEAKSKRHRDKIHGADLIRASIRKKKPQTLAELIQSNAEKSKKSWVNNVNKDIFVPPELFGVMEEPEKEEEEEQKQNKSYQSFDENSTPSEVWHLQSAPKTNSLAIDKPEETFNIASSPAKQRKNPFNDSALLEENLALKTENQISENGTAHLYETPDRNTLSPSVENVSRKNLQNSESKESKKNSREVANGTQRSTGQPPIPKARTLTYQIGDAQSDSDSTFSKSAKRNDLNNSTGTRKGILKRNSSSSSTDSEILRIGQNFDSQNKNAPPTSPILEGVIEKNSIAEQSEESAQNALDRLKHVRFSSNVSQKAQTPELHRGKELGEYDLLESDLTKNGLDGFNESQKGPRVSESALVSQSSSSTDMPEAGHGLPKPMLPSQSRSSAVESVVNISEEESRFSKHSSERDPKSVSNVPQDSSFSKHATPSESHSSTKDTRSTTDVSQQKHSPSRPYNTNRSHPSIEVSQQEKSPPTEIVSERTNFNQISSNLNKNKVPRETVPAKEPAQLLNLETQPTKFSIDQQPIYAEIKKSPQVSKPNSADLEQDQQPIYAVIKKSPQVLKPNSTDLQQGSEEELNPVLNALKRSTAKSKPSKSLEDIPSVTSNQRKVDIPKEVLSDEDDQKTDQPQETHESVPGISTVPSFSNKFSNPENLKRLSQSVPAFLQEESDDRETDSTSESSFQLGRHKKSPSSLTNLSGSSGMASMSSVSGSVMSIYSGDFGNVDIKGNIQFAIDYVEQLKEFHIFVAQCKDLAEADVKKHRSDPYVKSYLLPDKAKMGKRKTTVRKKTLNPAYNDILRYKIDRQTLLTQKLNLSVWHNDTFGRNSFLGEVELDLATWDWNNKQMNWFPLQPRTPAAGLALEHRGEMKLALKYVPQASTGKKSLENGEVHIWVKECRGLPLLRGNRINSFVKCTILPDTSRKSRQKTRSVEKTTNPVFNHTMVYDGFRSEDLSEACIELTVWDHNRLVNHFLGGLRIGLGTGKSYGTLVDWMDSTIDEASLWDRMINTQNAWVEDTLPLRMLMVAKMTK
ncbi:synaptotagmin-like protein 2 isoform X9 [Rhinatrema bivittatum]|uniref:synaptotagmin-like protein 2 isoform X9 n=1 Tax=Rhinatrema bivittatum TaxID=194408 RepID=UPI00112D49D4|nr:synaptotagmin-like protein 2 isoform X9 [Rhinatrema bivittatum]